MKKFNTGYRESFEAVLKTFSDSLESTTYEAGDEILPESSRPGDVAFVIEGLVTMESDSMINGRRQHLVWSLYGDLSWIGLECLMDGGRLAYHALIPSRVSLLPLDFVMTRMDPDLKLATLAQMADRNLESLSRNIGGLRGSLRERVMVTLLFIRSMTSLPEVSLTLSNLADLTGTSRTRITPLIKQFEQQGWVERGYKNYLIADTEILLQGLAALQKQGDQER